MNPCPSPNLSKEEVISLLRKSGTGFLSKDADFFNPGNKLISRQNHRLGVISQQKGDPESDEGESLLSTFCNVPGCNNKFATVGEFESHYNSLHRFNCAQCRKNLPSAHLLDLHLEENHDSYFEMLAKKKPSFRCFLEVCYERFQTPSERRDHGIKIHKLPSNFRFATKEKKITPVVVEKMEDDQGGDQKPIDPQVIKKSTVIKQKPITFGHNVPKSFDTSYAKALTKHDKKKTPGNLLEDNKMMVDLLESLPQ